MEILKSNVLVTGASRGLGRAIAVALAQVGADTIFINHLGDEENAEETRRLTQAHGAHAKIIEADISDPTAVNAMASKVHDYLGERTLGILVNNAGAILQPGSWNEQSDSDMQQSLMINLAGAMHCTRAFAPNMKKAERGVIVNIASDNGITGTAAIASYSAAKAGLIQYTRNMAVALAPQIRVNAVAPGVCDTDMTRSAGEEIIQASLQATPLQRLGQPEEIADAVLFLVRNEFTTGTILSVDGGITLPNK